MINTEEQDKLLVSIGEALEKPIITYAIGGTALMLRGLKEETLDIDLVFINEADRKTFIEAAEGIGFKRSDARLVYGSEKSVPMMIQFEEIRFDLFLGKVINAIFSDSIKERAKQTHEFRKNLIIKAADMHDILLMKSATSRIKDVDNIITILKTQTINWDIIVREAENQIESGNDIAILTLGTLLEKLRNKYKMDIPLKVLDKLWALLNKQVRKTREETNRKR